MALTPQTNTTLEAIAEVLRGADDIVLCGHVSPDGDCIGSQLALAAALRRLGKRTCCILAKDEPVDANLRFLLGAAELRPAVRYEGAPGVFVAVDVPNAERLGAGADVLARSSFGVTIDHHAAPERMTDVAYVDPDSPSTTMIVWELAKLLGAECDEAVATCCYTGLVTDTGRFQYQNTSVSAFEAAAEMVRAGAAPAYVATAVFQNRSLASMRLEALMLDRMLFAADGQLVLSWLALDDFESLGAVKADAEPLINTLRMLSGVRIACILREQADGIRGSLRAKDDTDVSAIARALGGGGHKAAAGFTLACPMDEAVRTVLAALEPIVGAPCAEVRG